jgi:hypothetical protein
MRSRAGYWLGGGLIAAGAAAAVLWFVLSIIGISDTIEDFERVQGGATRTLHLEARKYVIYEEGPNVDEAPSGGVTVEIATAGDTHARVPTPSYNNSLTYTFGGHEGAARSTVTPPRPGDYRVSVHSDSNQGAVALGESIAGRIVRAILGAFAVGGLIGLGGIALLATTIVRRYNARKAANEPPSPFGQPPSH